MFELDFIQFEILLYYKLDDDKMSIVLDELGVLRQNLIIPFGTDLTDKFYQKYFEPDDTEFYKLINQK